MLRSPDIIANRLDPWHGAHFHPFSFAELRVIDPNDDMLKVRVAKRLFGGMCIETHATPIEEGRTAIIEATLASSDRKGFRRAMMLQRFIRPCIERSARRLSIDDAAYAERLYALRGGPSD